MIVCYDRIVLIERYGRPDTDLFIYTCTYNSPTHIIIFFKYEPFHTESVPKSIVY